MASMTTSRSHVPRVVAIALVALGLGPGCGDDGPPAGETTMAGADATTTTGTATEGALDGTGTASLDPTDEGPPGGSSTSHGEPDHGELLRIDLVPLDTVLEVDLDTPSAMAFAVLGHYEDGTLLDVTTQASLEHDPPLGVMHEASLELPPFADPFFGTTRITAHVDERVGEARLTVAAYARTGVDAAVLLVLPYGGEPSTRSLVFGTDIDRLDVLVNIDATGSMGGPINVLQGSLVGTVIPGIQAAVADAWLGVAAFMDYPIAPFGIAGCDQPFMLVQAMTASAVAAEDAMLSLTTGMFGGPIGCGNDPPESHIEALWQIATGEGLLGPAPTFVPPSASGRGGAGFREGALPVIVSITDAPSHHPGGPTCGMGVGYDADPAVLAVAATRAEAEVALVAICGRVVTMAVGNHDPACGPLADGVGLATATGARVPPQAWDVAIGGRPPGCAEGQCCTGLDGAGVAPDRAGGCPLAYHVAFGGGGLDQRITDGVARLAHHAPFTVTTAMSGATTSREGVPLPPGRDATAFVTSVVPLWHGPAPLAGVPDPVLTVAAFEGVLPTTPVAFELTAHNDLVPATDAPQLFAATITALADGCAVLDERPILFLVPPEPLPPPGS
jgi:hypothetical protein